MPTRKTLTIIGVTVIVVVAVILVALWQLEVIFPNRKIVSGQGLVPVNDETLNQYEQNSSQNPSPSLFFYLMNLTKRIPGMDNVNTQVFYSNASVATVLAQYNTTLKNQGYSVLPKYSGSYSQWKQTVSFNTFDHGMTGAVVILSNYQGKTWVCYVVGSVLDLYNIYDYLSNHGYLNTP